MASRSPSGRRHLVAIATAGLATIVTVLLASPVHARADASGTTDDAARELAERYAPIVGIQTQREACGPGEPYLPTSALDVTDQRGVLLRDAAGRVITEAPTAADLAAASDEWHIDYPGDALNPGCDFERWLRALDPTPAIHARVTVPADHPELTVVQYWFFWIYNEWNNLHEGDWEMMQIVFEAGSPAEALTVDPVRVGLTQHEGAERADWVDVQMRDGRAVVYPAGGSHAMFFEQDRFLGKSADAGFGCDDTRAPTTFIDPAVIMLPAVDATGDDAWLQWVGRWGERHPSFKNGPTGPYDKRSWDDPIGWIDNARTHSLRAPDFGNDVTDFFCSATERVSMLLVHWFDTPWLFVSSLLAIVAAIVVIARRTRWTPRTIRPLAARRTSGQIVGSAAVLLWRERRRYAPVATLILAGGVVAAIVRRLVLLLPTIGDANLLLDGDPISQVFFALISGSLIVVPVGIVATAIAAATTDCIDGDVAPRTFGDLLRDRAVWAAVGVIALLALLLGPFTFLIGAFLLARWATAPVVALRQGRMRGSLRGAARLTKGRRVRTGALMITCTLVATMLGPFVGSLVLIAFGTSFGLVNIVSSLITAVTVPWLAVVEVMLHGDLQSRADGDVVPETSPTPAADEPAPAASLP